MNNSLNIGNSEYEYIDFEQHMKEAIKDSKYIEHVVMGDILDDVTSDIILDLLNSPKVLEVDDLGLIFVSEDGERKRCPNYGINLSADGKWLSSKIRPVDFDIEQNGNLRKAAEAQAAYCLIAVNCVLQDENVKNEIRGVVMNYDYDTMAPLNGKPSFQQLLQEFQDYQSTLINVAINAAKFNISNIKKDSEKFLKENIPEDRLSGLRELDARISDINRSYSLGKLSPENVMSLTKLEILGILKEREDRINILLNGGSGSDGKKVLPHPCSTIWKILNLSSEYVNPLTKRSVSKFAEDEVIRLYTKYPLLVQTEGEMKLLIDKWKKRYIKMARLSVRKNQIEKFLNNEAEYVLPVKL